jgi:hypothetical protein
MTIQFPIIISDSGDITVFDSLERAESYLEPCDMNVLTGFDCQGKILEFGGKKEIRKILWRTAEIEKISVHANAMGHTNKEELQKLLVRYLGRIYTVHKEVFIQRDWEQLSLQELIDIIKDNALV